MCKNQQKSFINLDTRSDNSRSPKRSLVDDGILNRIASCFSIKRAFKRSKPLPVIELVLMNWYVLQNSLNFPFISSRSSNLKNSSKIGRKIYIKYTSARGYLSCIVVSSKPSVLYCWNYYAAVPIPYRCIFCFRFYYYFLNYCFCYWWKANLVSFWRTYSSRSALLPAKVSNVLTWVLC